VLTTSRALVAIAVRTIDSAPVQVTMVQHRVLVLLAGHGTLTVSEIADLLGVDQSNASRHCARLEKLGVLDRSRSAQDGRVVEVRLTSAGRGLIGSVTDSRRREIAKVLARMPEDEVQAAVAAFRSFNDAAQEPADRDWMPPAS
jgi:DNA-binding MarR family transcriptional regulator